MSHLREDAAIFGQSFLQVAARGLEALTAAAGFVETERATAAHLLHDLLRPWGHELVGAAPRMTSDIGDDQFPIEFSLAFGGTGAAPEIRLLFEARTSGGSMVERWRAGHELAVKLERDHGAKLDGLRLVEDLFIPDDPHARYAMWHSVCLRRHHDPRFKVYLNPQAQGESRAPSVIAEALRRLGFQHAADASRCMRPGDRYKFFSLDLVRPREARVKTYKIHHDATRGDIEAELAAATSYSAGILDSFWRIIAGEDGPFDRLPLSTYLSWRVGDDPRPSTGTLHFPIRAYVDNDQLAYDRIRQLLPEADRAVYERAIGAFAARPLASGVGLHAYVSLGLDRGPPRVTIYLAPEGYHVAPPRIVSLAPDDHVRRTPASNDLTMHTVLAAIERRSQELDRAPLFHFVADSSIDPRQRLAYAPCLAHFVMTFADLYALVFREEPAKDRLQEIVNAHTYEDGGHWKWFLADLPKLACDPTLLFSEALQFIWGAHSVRLRKLSYHICSLALGASSLCKLVLVQCIEAAGKISLRHVSRAAQDFTRETGKTLTYFGTHHFDTEGQHTLEQDEVYTMIKGLRLAPEVSKELISLVDHSFHLFTAFTEDLLAFATRDGGASAQSFAVGDSECEMLEALS